MPIKRKFDWNGFAILAGRGDFSPQSEAHAIQHAQAAAQLQADINQLHEKLQRLHAEIAALGVRVRSQRETHSTIMDWLRKAKRRQ